MANFNAPIALFVYNRPEHTRRTLSALSRNVGAEFSKLFIFADGLRQGASDDERRELDDVRRLIRERKWCGTVEITESDENRGLRQSICDGINAVLEFSDRVIVLEDDLETSPGFLKYMNKALEMYKDQDEIFQVSGFMVRNRWGISRTGFLRVSTSWGWGTWRRAWAHYRDDAKNLLEEVERKDRSAFDLDGYSFHFEELNRNVKGELKTWAVRWYASVFLKGGLCLYPRKTLVRNIGFDGTGIHCHDDKTNYHQKLRLARRISVSRVPLKENVRYLKAMQSNYKRLLQLWTGTTWRARLHKKFKHSLKSN